MKSLILICIFYFNKKRFNWTMIKLLNLPSGAAYLNDDIYWGRYISVYFPCRKYEFQAIRLFVCISCFINYANSYFIDLHDQLRVIGSLWLDWHFDRVKCLIGMVYFLWSRDRPWVGGRSSKLHFFSSTGLISPSFIEAPLDASVKIICRSKCTK